jgi:hypothetical protein
METTAADLFERHHVAIFRFFRRVTGNPDLAEDLTQDVFVRVVKALAEYQPRGRETGWLFQIARTVPLDQHRRRPEPGAPVSRTGKQSRPARPRDLQIRTRCAICGRAMPGSSGPHESIGPPAPLPLGRPAYNKPGRCAEPTGSVASALFIGPGPGSAWLRVSLGSHARHTFSRTRDLLRWPCQPDFS